MIGVQREIPRKWNELLLLAIAFATIFGLGFIR